MKLYRFLLGYSLFIRLFSFIVPLCFVTAKSMARVAEEAAITAAQEAKRAAGAAQELMLKAKEAADKARRAMEIAEVNNERNSDKDD